MQTRRIPKSGSGSTNRKHLLSIMVHYSLSGPSSVWWWSWVQSSSGESLVSVSCPPLPTGCQGAPSDFPGCTCACRLSPVLRQKNGAVSQVGHISISFWILNRVVKIETLPVTNGKRLPQPRAPASWDCEQGMKSSLPTVDPCSWSGSLQTWITFPINRFKKSRKVFREY